MTLEGALRVLGRLQDWRVDLDTPPGLDAAALRLLPDDAGLRGRLRRAAGLDMAERVALASEAMAAGHRVLNSAIRLTLAAQAADTETHLQPGPSFVKAASQGLFTTRRVCKGDTVLYYAGDVHDFSGKNRLEDQSYVLRIGRHSLWNDGEIFVYPSQCSFLACRYMNDPRNESLYNVAWRQTDEDAARFRCAVVAIKDIAEGHELFIDYGDAYWRSSSVAATVLTGEMLKTEKRSRRRCRSSSS